MNCGQKTLGLVLVIFFCGICFSQTGKIDSLEVLVRTSKEDTSKITHLNNLGWEFRNSNPDTAILLSKQALYLAEKLKASPYEDLSKAGKKGMANSLGNIGACSYLKGDYPTALDNYFKALKLDKELGNKKGIATRLGNIGIIYMDEADYAKAIDYYFRALKLDEELENKNGMARHLSHIGLIYKEQSDYAKALEYYLRALKIKEELGDKNGVAVNLGNIGVVYYKQANYPKALYYYSRALKMTEELGNKPSQAANLCNIGNVYKNQADYNKALEYYLKALRIGGDKRGTAVRLGNIGLLYTLMAGSVSGAEKRVMADKAEKYLLDALRLAKEIGALNEERLFEDDLSDLYAKTNRYQLALEHYKKAMILKDTIFSQESKKQLVKKEMNFQFEKKEAIANAEHKKELESQKAIAEEKNRKQLVIMLSVIGCLLLVGAFAAFILRSLRAARRQKMIIEGKQKEILDSIHYAKRIQKALITSEFYFEKSLTKLKQ